MSSLGHWRELSQPQYLMKLGLVCLAVWLHAADSLLVSTMMPVIVNDIGGGHLIAWAFALYEMGSIAAGSVSAFYMRRYGLKLTVIVAAVTFALGCLVSATAPAMWIMLCGRILQGAGGGALVALSFVAITVLFPRHLMPRVMAAVSTFWGVSAFLGPLIGAVFASQGVWRGGFWFFATQAVLLTVWVTSGLKNVSVKQESSSDRQASVQAPTARVPLRRLCLLCIGVLAFAAAGIDVGWLKSSVLLLIGILMFYLLLKLDSRSGADRLFPPRAVDIRTPMGSVLLMILFMTMASIAVTVYGTILLIALHDVSLLQAGYVVALSSIGWSVAALTSSGVKESNDPLMIRVGAGMLLLTIVGLALTMRAGPLWMICIFTFTEGVAFGMAWTFILRRATALAPKAEQQRLAAAIPTTQRLGYALGAAYLGLIANSIGFGVDLSVATARVAASSLFIACLPLALLGVFAMWRFTGFPHRPVL